MQKSMQKFANTNLDMSTNDLQRTYNNTLTRNLASSNKTTEPIIQATFQAEIFPEIDQGDHIMPSDSDMEDNDGVPDKEISQSQQFANYVRSIGDIGTLQQHLAVTALAQADLYNGKIHDIFMENQGIQSCFRCINAMSQSQLNAQDRERIISQGRRAVDPEDVSKILEILFKFCQTDRNIRAAAIGEEGVRVALSLARYRFNSRYSGANQLKANALNLLKAMLKDTKSRLFFHRIGGVEIITQLMHNPNLIDSVSGCILQALRSQRILRHFFKNNVLSDILQLQRGLTPQLLKLLEFVSSKVQGVEQLITFGGIQVVCNTLHDSQNDTSTTQGAVAILANCARRSGSDPAVQQSLGDIVSLLTSQDYQTSLAVCQTIVNVCYHEGNDCEEINHLTLAQKTQMQSGIITKPQENHEENVKIPGRDISRYNMLNIENCTQISAINILPKLLPHIHCTADVIHNDPTCPIVKFDEEKKAPVDATADRALCSAATRALASLLFCESLRNQVNADKLASKTIIEHLSASDIHILRYTLLCVAHLISDRESSNKYQYYFLKKIQKKDRYGRIFAMLRHPLLQIRIAAAQATAALLKNQDLAQTVFRASGATLQGIASQLTTSGNQILQQLSTGMQIDYDTLRLVVELLTVVWQLCRNNIHACKVFSEYGILQTVLGLIKNSLKPVNDYQLYVVTKMQEYLARVLSCLVRVGDNGAVSADSGIISVLATWYVCEASPYSYQDTMKAKEHGVALFCPKLREAFSAVCKSLSANHKCCLLLHQSNLDAVLLDLVSDESDCTAADAASALRAVRMQVIRAIDGFRQRVSSEKQADPEVIQQTINFVTFQQERHADASKSNSFVKFQSYVAGEDDGIFEDDEAYKSRILANRDADGINVLIPNAALAKSVVELSNQILQNELKFQLHSQTSNTTNLPTITEQSTVGVTDQMPRDMKASLTVTKLFKEEPVPEQTTAEETKEDTNSLAVVE